MTEFERIEAQIERWDELSAIDKMELVIGLHESGHIHLLPEHIIEHHIRHKITYGWLKNALAYLKNPPADNLQ